MVRLFFAFKMTKVLFTQLIERALCWRSKI